MKHETMAFKAGVLHLLDQRKLPEIVEYFQARTYKDVAFAIGEMVV